MGVGADVGGAQHPTIDVLGDAKLPVGVVAVVDVLQVEHADVGR